jgi:hypothetical protein
MRVASNGTAMKMMNSMSITIIAMVCSKTMSQIDRGTGLVLLGL